MSVKFEQPKVPTETYPLACRLEELYNGAVKHVPITRRRLTPDGVLTAPVQHTLTVQLLPGMRDKTAIVFPKEGSERPGDIPADVKLVVETQVHPTFRRDGDTLVHRAAITLGQALLGTVVHVPTLDGRTLTIPVTEIVRPGYTKTVPGEGMPILDRKAQHANPAQQPARRGALIIEFDVAFPRRLNPRQKELITQTGL
eukprot:gnl/Trimastix_PCT/2625.p1 GENE.gnl/Trimastix_PCT/2625~~gnl/Trimastix_PCT/2625.p1  ORF type:complete len:199 (+),score=76.88 gnl/Trimastix_PCT/2625:430-1026(+)